MDHQGGTYQGSSPHQRGVHSHLSVQLHIVSLSNSQLADSCIYQYMFADRKRCQSVFWNAEGKRDGWRLAWRRWAAPGVPGLGCQAESREKGEEAAEIRTR
jgi:hypothetical protein